MAVLNPRKTAQALLKKGFSHETGDHNFFEYWHNGKCVTYTKISHSAKKEIHDGLIKAMSEQCKLSKSDFIDLIKCTLSAEAYLLKLRDGGHIDEDKGKTKNQ